MAHTIIPRDLVSDSMLAAADRRGISVIELTAGILAFRGKHSQLVILLAEEHEPNNDIALADAVADIQLEDENL